MENIKLIQKIAWEYHYKTGIDFQELFSEASLGYAEALRTYKTNSKPRFCTLAWKCMDNQLKYFINDEMRYRINFSPVEDWSLLPGGSSGTLEDMEHLYNSIPDDCKVLYTITLSEAETFQKMEWHHRYGWTKFARGFLITQLREFGWTWPRIWKAFKDFKKALNETDEPCIIREIKAT